MRREWDIFDALTGDSPMLADIKDWMLPPFTDRDKEKWPKIDPPE